jgi:hypothetical protein
MQHSGTSVSPDMQLHGFERKHCHCVAHLFAIMAVVWHTCKGQVAVCTATVVAGGGPQRIPYGWQWHSPVCCGLGNAVPQPGANPDGISSRPCQGLGIRLMPIRALRLTNVVSYLQ